MSEPESRAVNVVRGRAYPEPAVPAGYAVLMKRHVLQIAISRRLAGIAERHHRQSTPEWLLLTPATLPPIR